MVAGTLKKELFMEVPHQCPETIINQALPDLWWIAIFFPFHLQEIKTHNSGELETGISGYFPFELKTIYVLYNWMNYTEIYSLYYTIWNKLVLKFQNVRNILR